MANKITDPVADDEGSEAPPPTLELLEARVRALEILLSKVLSKHYAAAECEALAKSCGQCANALAQSATNVFPMPDVDATAAYYQFIAMLWAMASRWQKNQSSNSGVFVPKD